MQQDYCVKLPGVNFTNILLAAFMLVDPKSIKKIYNLTVIFTHLGSACLKAAHKMLMKLSPGVNFATFYS